MGFAVEPTVAAVYIDVVDTVGVDLIVVEVVAKGLVIQVVPMLLKPLWLNYYF